MAQGGPGSNLIDTRSVTPANFTALTNISAKSGGGTDQFYPSTSIPGTYDGQGTNSTVILEGTATNVVNDYGANTSTINGVAVAFPNLTGPIINHVQAANLTLKTGISHTLSDSPNPNSGVSRFTLTGTGLYTDFLNPTSSLTVQSTAPGITLAFNGLDKVSPPASVTVDAANLADTLAFGGSATNVTETSSTRRSSSTARSSTCPTRGRPISSSTPTPSTSPSSPAPAIIGSSRTTASSTTGTPALNASDGTFSDFKNPTGTLTVLDTNATGGSTYEFPGAERRGRPANINLDAAGNADTQVIAVPGVVKNVVEDLANSKVTVNGLVIGVPGSGPANVFLNMAMTNLTIQPGAGNHRILQDNGVANDGISRAFNASNGTYTDFKNPPARSPSWTPTRPAAASTSTRGSTPPAARPLST